MVSLLRGDEDMKTEKYAAQEKYDKENTIRTGIKFNKKTDADILEFLEKQTSKQGAIKAAIRSYMNEKRDTD